MPTIPRSQDSHEPTSDILTECFDLEEVDYNEEDEVSISNLRAWSSMEKGKSDLPFIGRNRP